MFAVFNLTYVFLLYLLKLAQQIIVNKFLLNGKENLGI